MKVENQISVSNWAGETFGTAGSNAKVAARANEEMAELLRALTADDNHPKAAEEVADIVIILYRVASRLGVDLLEEIDKKMTVNRKRKWNLDNTGHGYHVRDKKEPAEPEPCPAEPNQSILDACCGSCDRYTAEQNTVDPGTVNFITKMVDEIFDRIEEPFGKNVAEQPANQTEPQRGQFWAYNSNRKCCVRMIGKNLNGHWVAVHRHGEYEVFNGRGNMSFECWHHEPGFMNFDGPVEPVEPAEQKPSPSSAEKTTEKAAKQKDDEYPQYWTALEHENAYIRLDRNGNHYCIEKDGTTTGPHEWAYVNHEGRKRLTKEEAEAMLKVNKPEPPSSPAKPPTNQQLFEMIANLGDQMNGMNERLRIVERVAAV